MRRAAMYTCLARKRRSCEWDGEISRRNAEEQKRGEEMAPRRLCRLCPILSRFAVLVAILVIGSGLAAAQQVPEPAASNDGATTGTPVEVWNRVVVVVRAPFGNLTPEERASAITERILALPAHQPEYIVEALPAKLGPYTGAWITVNGKLAFGLLEEDADAQVGETFEQLTERATTNLHEWLVARDDQQRLPVLLRGIGLAVAATIVLMLLVGGLIRFGRRGIAHIGAAGEDQSRSTVFAGANIRPYLISLEIGVLRLAMWGVALPLAYLWITFVLRQFPYSHPWSRELSDSLFELFGSFGQAILASLPNLAAVLVIFLLTRVVVRVVSAFFRNAESGTLEAPWLQPETARATRRVLTVLIWTFALVVSYPYIPGSQTDAFKGVSVFLGLMVTLGSAGLVGQIIGGLVVVYSRAFRMGDYVKIGEYEGTVKELGLLSTKIETVAKQEITIPNAVLIGSTVTNYSYDVTHGGAVVMTSVTIGYDAPWRQVHALLLLAAERTPRVLREPPPRVMQRTLADFYVEYRLFFLIEHPAERYLVLSDLHAQIQDAFNEFGVQIMSPNFVAQPDRPVVVPKESWFVAPSRGNGATAAPATSSSD
jgi:small-conductance mechanosensitive channel